jgi:serine/threonine-protein kinase
VIGEVIGNYRIVSELGKGGMGVVYRAEHVQLGKPAALKMLLPQLCHDPAIVQRFFNEARAASAIDHPGIVEVFDFGIHRDGRAYLVMALLRGESLETRLGRAPLPAVEGASIVAQVASALAAAHARGIVHRDLKPDNIYLVPNELVAGGLQIKLLDFGIAKLADEQTAGLKTQTGALMGTPAYMSPEQCMGRPDLDHRTDLYSLGCILFHVLCGRPPFTTTQGAGVMIAAHLRDPAPDPRSLDPAIPAALAAITLRLLEKDPGARYQSAAEVRAALIAAGADAPATRPPQSQLAYGATLAAPGTALTTASGSAAEAIAAPPPRTRSRARYLVVGGLVGAGAVVAAVLVSTTSSTSSPPPPPAAIAAPSPANPPPALPAPSPPPPSPSAAEATVARAPAHAACPQGQLRDDDTHDHCCWPGQAWSTPKARCIGAPSCPSGMIAQGEQCRAPSPAPTLTASPAPTASGTPRLALDRQSYPPAATIVVRFATAMRSPEDHRAWITFAAAGSPAATYGDWVFVDDGATSATLKAPEIPGAYELRLHADYPTQKTNLVASTPFTVGGDAHDGATPASAQRFQLAKTTLHVREPIQVTFTDPLIAKAGEKFWITTTDRSSADDVYGDWEYVAPAARTATLNAPAKPGDYEVRLHANYPTMSTHVVHRATIHVID